MDYSQLSKEELLAEKGRLQQDLELAQLAQMSRPDLIAERDRLRLQLAQQEAPKVPNPPNSPVEEESFLAREGRGAARGVRDALTGLASTVDLPLLPGNLYGLGKQAITGKPHEWQTTGIPGAVQEGIDKLTGGYTKPRGSGEEMWSSIAQGVAGMPGGAGAAKAVGNAAKGIKVASKAAAMNPRMQKAVQGVLSGAKHLAGAGTAPTLRNIGATAGATGVAHHYAQKNPDDLLGILGYSTLGGIAGSTATAGLRNAGRAALTGNKYEFTGPLNRGIAKAAFMRVNDDKTAAALKAGITPLPTDVMDNSMYKYAHNLLFNMGHQKATRKAIAKNAEEIGRILPVDEALSDAEMGRIIGHNPNKRGRDTSILGRTKAKAAAKAERTGNEIKEELFKPNESGLIPGATIEIPHTQAYFNKQDIKSRGSKAAQELMNDTPLNKFKKSLNNALDESPDGMVAYSYLDQLRKKVGNEVKKPLIYGPEEKGQLSHLYSNILKDMEGHVAKHTSKSDVWNKRRKDYFGFMQDVENHINPMSAKGAKEIDNFANDWYNSLKQGSNKSTILFENATKAEKKHLADYAFKRMGLNTEGDWKELAWAKKMKFLKSKKPEVYQALKENMPDRQTAKNLENIIETMKNREELLKHANFSGSAAHGVLYQIGSTGAQVAAGILHPLIPVVSLAFTHGLEKGLLANPDFVKSIYYANKVITPRQVPVAINMLKKSGAITKDKAQELLEWHWHNVQNPDNKAKYKNILMPGRTLNTLGHQQHEKGK